MSASFDQYLIKLSELEGKHAAVKFCIDTKGWDLRSSKKYVDKLEAKTCGHVPAKSDNRDNLKNIPKNAIKWFAYFICICLFPVVINIPGCIRRNQIEKETILLLEMANSSIDKGDTAIAIINYLKIIEINPGFLPAYYDLTDIYRNKGDTIQVQKIKEKIIILEEPYDPGI